MMPYLGLCSLARNLSPQMKDGCVHSYVVGDLGPLGKEGHQGKAGAHAQHCKQLHASASDKQPAGSECWQEQVHDSIEDQNTCMSKVRWSRAVASR